MKKDNSVSRFPWNKFSISRHADDNSDQERRSLIGSKLSWILLISLLLIWGLNAWSTYRNFNQQIELEIQAFEREALEDKRAEVELIFKPIYEHIRTISLLPSIRRVGGFNRFSDEENVVSQGRLSLDTHQTIQQIYRNLHHSVELSEIYYVLDGFEPDLGQVPFFMYDEHILNQNGIFDDNLSTKNESLAEEYELDEYRYYQVQLAWYKAHYPEWTHTNDITKIPAIVSPLMRTCDNTQYINIDRDDVKNTNGMLYSVPVFNLNSKQFTGVISAVLRANIIESALVGVPFIPLTKQDFIKAEEIGMKMPEQKSNFVLVNEYHDIEIFDRRNEYLNNSGVISILNNDSDYRVSSISIGITSDSNWTLYNYLTDTQIASITQKTSNRLFQEMMARVVLLFVLVMIFIKAARDQFLHQEKLFELAHYDGLTKLPNRHYLYVQLEDALENAMRKNTRVGLMFLDIDDFGIINDTMSHRIGDEVLKTVAKRLTTKSSAFNNTYQPLLGTPPIVARLGGDDFALIFKNLPSVHIGAELGERQLNKFSTPVEIDGQIFDISLTGGMSIYPDDGANIHEIMANTDYALKHAMDYGVSQFQMFNDDMRQFAARQNRLLRDLTETIRSNGFSIHYQPKQSLGTDQVFSFEALMRWDHPELGFVSPAEFIPLLEQTGQIVDAGRWILEQSCIQLKDWKERGYNDINISVNVSAKQLLLSDMVLTVETILDDLSLTADNLILEITESLMIDNLVDSSKILDRIRKRGVRLAIDDFGTGYSSLTYLQGLPIDYLKLDKSMIDVISDVKGAHVTRATIDLAHGLGLKTIAEGVEDQHQRQVLKEMGCDMIQGYLLSRPLPADQLEPFLVLSQSKPQTA